MQPDQPDLQSKPDEQSQAPLADPSVPLETTEEFISEESLYDDKANESGYQDEPIQWQAPEYLQEQRSPWWFIIFWVVVVVIILIAAFVVKSLTFAILVPVMAAALMLYSHRPPRNMAYVLSNKGLYINEKLHPLSEFKGFGVAKDDALPSLMLLPVKRFRPALNVHFPEEYGEDIVDFLGERIPMQELKLDIFDKLIRKLHL